MVLEHLLLKGTITPLDALVEYGCFRLGARIYDLKKRGYKIMTHHETKNGKTYARYELITEGEYENTAN
jgi:hypothetical protein